MTASIQRTAVFSADVEAALEHYATNAGHPVALRFVGALEAAVAQLAAFPQAGSRQLAEFCGVPVVRSGALDGIPYLVFYVPRSHDVLLVRCLHERRDLPPLLRDARDT